MWLHSFNNNNNFFHKFLLKPNKLTKKKFRKVRSFLTKKFLIPKNQTTTFKKRAFIHYRLNLTFKKRLHTFKLLKKKFWNFFLKKNSKNIKTSLKVFKFRKLERLRSYAYTKLRLLNVKKNRKRMTFPYKLQVRTFTKKTKSLSLNSENLYYLA